jgi:hypothetical protein
MFSKLRHLFPYTFIAYACIATLFPTSLLHAQGDVVRAPSQWFRQRHDYPVGKSPYGIATADFNQDGFLDFVVPNQGGPSITVLNGDGHGNFVSDRTYLADQYITAVATGDVDGDGYVDIVASNLGTVSVFRNHDDGTFANRVDYPAGATAEAIEIADLNDDGTLDLVEANFCDVSCSAGQVVVLLGRGDGSFPSSNFFMAGKGAASVAIADLNIDGFPDIVVPDWNNVGKTVSVLLGQGDGSFSSEVEYAGGGSPRKAVVADFNHDGKADIVVGNVYQKTLSMLPGLGDGRFRNRQLTTAGAYAWWLVTNDFNLDGKPDIAVSNYDGASSGDSVSVFLGKGNGQFSAPSTFATGKAPIGIVSADLDGDGKADLATANFLDRSVTVLLTSPAQ